MSDSRRVSGAPSSQALLRYSVLAQVEALVLGGWEPSLAIQEVARREHSRLDGRAVRVSVRTIQRWRAAYGNADSLSALEPKRRSRPPLALSDAFVEFLVGEKTSDPRASIPEILRRAKLSGVVAADAEINRTSVWRACLRLNLPTRWGPSKREADSRRWRYAQRMACVLADGKYFRAGPSRLRRVAIFYLDDATRYALHVVVGTSETTELFLRGLYELVLKHGLPDLIYLDRGTGFKSADTLAVVKNGLRAWLIHGKKKYPEGHGAIERFNRTAYQQVLRSLDGAADVDPHCEALELRLRHFLGLYNSTPHETLGKKITPQMRWEEGRPLRYPADQAALYRCFIVRETRKVSTDHVIKVDGRLWEAPRGLADRSVEVMRNVLDGRLWVTHHDRIVTTHDQCRGEAVLVAGNLAQDVIE